MSGLIGSIVKSIAAPIIDTAAKVIGQTIGDAMGGGLRAAAQKAGNLLTSIATGGFGSQMSGSSVAQLALAGGMTEALKGLGSLAAGLGGGVSPLRRAF